MEQKSAQRKTNVYMRTCHMSKVDLQIHGERIDYS